MTIKCKNCSTDIQDDFSNAISERVTRDVSEHITRNMPRPEPVIQTKERVIIKHPPEMKKVWCVDCHDNHDNPDYRKPTHECLDCDAKLDSSRKECPYCGSDDVDKQGWF